MAEFVVQAPAEGPVLVFSEGISFWGGVDPETGRIIDARHPQHGEGLAGRIVLMPTSRGSCSGSGVLLDLALNGQAPAALVFRESEDILTLGALLAGRMFNRPLAVLRLAAPEYDALAAQPAARITPERLEAGTLSISLAPAGGGTLALTNADRAMLDGAEGAPVQLAMETICAMAAAQGATSLTDVGRAHIDGCIYAGPAYLKFAETVADMGAKVRIPATMNAISVDYGNWRSQGVAPDFGLPAIRLADAYVRMGCQPSYTCAPYLLNGRPDGGEDIAWAESNAVIYANSVLGARTVKHPDFLDLFIALTGRAPLSGVYLENNRRPQMVLDVAAPAAADDAFWPLLGWLAGRAAPDRIPLIRGVAHLQPDEDDLKGLCAAFGTTSAAPMLHVEGITPEADLPPAADAGAAVIAQDDFAWLWQQFNAGTAQVDLVAFGSPHFSASECRKLAALLAGRHCHAGTAAMVTMGRQALDAVRADGTLAALEAAGVRVVADICWCSITEPVFPPDAKVLMTNSGKYAHYAPGLSGRAVRFGGLEDCVRAALTGRAPETLPAWLAPEHAESR